MKIVIIGGGPAGILSSILLKQKYVSSEVILVEKEERIGKKIYVSGNGRCNVASNYKGENLYNAYRYPKFAQNIFEGVDVLSLLNNLGIDLKLEGNLWYPYTESAKTVMDVFNYHLKRLGVIIKTRTELKEYVVKDKQIEVILSNETIFADKLIIACGGKSSPVHGSNGMIFDILAKHNYTINDLYPGLVPITVKEDVSLLKGIKVKCEVKLVKDNKVIYKEKGEVLFKEDGLGGIAIMNCSSYIARLGIKNNYQIKLDLFPHLTKEQLLDMWIKKEQNGYPYLDGSLISSLARYVEKMTSTKGRKNKEELEKVANIVKSLTFTYDSLYSFKSSQVTVGGLSLEEINNNLESKKEKNVYFIGEVLDNDGLCGGLNLMWCFATAFKLSIE